jgi:hypothetical protein
MGKTPDRTEVIEWMKIEKMTEEEWNIFTRIFDEAIERHPPIGVDKTLNRIRDKLYQLHYGP